MEQVTTEMRMSGKDRNVCSIARRPWKREVGNVISQQVELRGPGVSIHCGQQGVMASF